MIKFNKFRINRIICVVLFIALMVMLFNSFINIPTFDKRRESNIGKIYYLSSMNFSTLPDYSTVKFTQADISPLENKYKEEIINEDNLIKQKKVEPIDMASKRVTEIYQWGNLLKINYNFKNTPNLEKFKTWEYLINRYVFLIDEQTKIINSANMSYLEKSEKLSQLYGLINYHSQNIFQIIGSIEKTQEEKQYLISLINSKIIAKLNEIKPILAVFEPNKTIYSIKEISDNNDWGVYKVSFSTLGLNSVTEKSIDLNVDNSTSSGILKKKENGLNEIFFQNITINNKQSVISLINSPAQALDNRVWSETKSAGNDFDYSLVLPLEKAEKYYLSFNIDFPFDIYFKIEDNYFDILSNNSKTSSLLSNSWIYLNKANKGNFSQMIPIQRKSPSYTVKIIFRSKQKLDELFLNNLAFKWIPINDFKIKLEKIEDNFGDVPEVSIKRHNLFNYVITINNYNKELINNLKNSIGTNWKIVKEDKTETTAKLYLRSRPQRIYILLLTILLLFIVSGLKIFKNLSEKLFILLKTIYINESYKAEKATENCSAYFIKIRWWILMIFLSIFILGIIYGQKASNILFIIAVIVWLLTVLSWRIEVRFSLALSVILLTICAIFRSFNFIGAAEWAAIWSYLFLFASLLQIFIFKRIIKPDNKFEEIIQSVKNYFMRKSNKNN